ncbi:DUF4844 domain-containing protein [Pontibacter sp. G13]|uniref:DUF4844 domain-containing protein n=1 Tax=Pontibacter sp. G13 TaxID=3074898 RepID=UPI00288A5DA6|nr:DUF4844 domain-containing protein [Pontibacter sp. G13]WNJ17117.1 DUF4844 domain-containing protein [Pontibacter sp. G13]
MDIQEKLTALRSTDKFPLAEWSNRGLNPSSPEVISRMNEEVDKLIDLILSKINEQPSNLLEEVQKFFDDWDNFDFDTEESEYIVDVMCEPLLLAGVDVQSLII